MTHFPINDLKLIKKQNKINKQVEISKVITIIIIIIIIIVIIIIIIIIIVTIIIIIVPNSSNRKQSQELIFPHNRKRSQSRP